MTQEFPTIKKMVHIEDVVKNSWNPNVQDDKTFQREINSIKTHGFIDPILVREKDDTYEIIDGEHRWKACLELKYKQIPVESMGKVDDATAKILTIKLNNLRGRDDILKRAQILKELNKGQLKLLPFDSQEIEEELKLLDFDFSQYDNADVPDDKKERAEKILQLALNLDNLLRALHNELKDVKAQLLIEQYNDWFKVFNNNFNKD